MSKQRSGRGLIRVDLTTGMAHTGRVFFVQDDGTEVEISSCVQRIEIDANIGDANKARLHVVLVEGHTNAEVEEIVLTRLKPRKKGKLRDITTLADVYTKAVKA